MPDKSNKKLPITRLTAAIKVIKNYCLQDFCPGLFEMLEPMRKHRQSVASTGRVTVASTRSMRTHKPQPMHRLGLRAKLPGCRGAKVIIDDESELPAKLLES